MFAGWDLCFFTDPAQHFIAGRGCAADDLLADDLSVDDLFLYHDVERAQLLT